MVILFLGPSGCGKGTQADLLAKRLGNLPVIAMGDAIRWAYAERIPEGVSAVEKYTDKGHLVPNNLVVAILKEYLRQFDLSLGAVFDSFPRTPSQVPLFDALLKDLNENLVAVIHLDTSEETARKRMRVRAENDLKKTGKVRRDEDEEAIKNRYSFYRQEVVPLLDIFRDRNVLITVDNSGTIEEVHRAIIKSLKLKGIALP